MNPLKILQDRGEVDAALVTEAESLVTDTGKTYEEALIELGLDADQLRTSQAEYFEVSPYQLPEVFHDRSKCPLTIFHSSHHVTIEWYR
jgi:hypothetical protein